jgi:tetratricopeptide (TPR) repeat protein
MNGYCLFFILIFSVTSSSMANSNKFYELVKNTASKEHLSLARGSIDTTLTVKLLTSPMGKYADERLRVAKIVTRYTQQNGKIVKASNAWDHVLLVRDLAAFGFFTKAFHEVNRIQPHPQKQNALAYITIAAKAHREEELAKKAWEMAQSLKVKNKEYYFATWLAAKTLFEKSSLRKAFDDYVLKYRRQNEDLEYNARELANIAMILLLAGSVEEARLYTAKVRAFLEKNRAENRSHWSDIIVDTARLTRWLEGERVSAQFLINKTSVFGIWPECQLTLKPLLKRHETKAAEPLLRKLFKHPPYAAHSQFGTLPIFLARGHLYDEAIERIEIYERKKKSYYGFSDLELACARLGVGLLLHRFGRKHKGRRMIQKALKTIDSANQCISLALLFSYWELEFSQDILQFLKKGL